MESPAQLTLWPHLAAGWRQRPAAERRAVVDAAARAARAAWQAGADLRTLPPAALGFQLGPAGLGAQFPPGLLTPHPRPLAPPIVRAALAQWQDDLRDVLAPGEALRFLRGFLPELGRASMHYQARRISALADRLARRRAADRYAGFLGDAALAPANAVVGRWQTEPGPRPEDLLAAVQQAEKDPAAHRIKSGPTITVTRARLWDEDVIIKRFDLPTNWARWKYWKRPSRARRAWAAGQLMRLSGLPTPEPLGYVEIRRGHLPITSYAVARFAAGAQSGFRWARRTYRRLDEADRAAARREILTLLRDLYAQGIYHGDTKLTNLLVEMRPDGTGRAWQWTDLECVSAGVRLTRRRLLRNLIQLNGSLRHWVSREDRQAFLAALARRYPWLAAPAVAADIERRTRQRLQRERDGRTPPDGRPRS